MGLGKINMGLGKIWELPSKPGTVQRRHPEVLALMVSSSAALRGKKKIIKVNKYDNVQDLGNHLGSFPPSGPPGYLPAKHADELLYGLKEKKKNHPQKI